MMARDKRTYLTYEGTVHNLSNVISDGPVRVIRYYDRNIKALGFVFLKIDKPFLDNPTKYGME